MSAKKPAAPRAPRVGKTRPRRRRAAIAGVTALALLGGGFAVAQAGTAASADRFVTALATTGGVEQTLTGTGTVGPVTSAEASFPASAVVTGVFAEVGDHVTTGQQLATIDTTALQNTVDEKVQALAQATLALEQAEEAESSAPSGTSSTSGGSGTTSGSRATSGSGATPGSGTAPSAGAGSPGTGTPDSGSSASDLAAVTVELTTAQQELDAAWSTFVASIAHATTVCSATPSAAPSASASATTIPTASTSAAPSTATPTTDASGSGGASPTPSSQGNAKRSDAGGTPSAAPSPSATGLKAKQPKPSDCIAALEGTGPAEDAMTAAKEALNQTIAALVSLATDAAAANEASGGTGSGTGGGTGTDNGGTAGGGTTDGGTTGTGGSSAGGTATTGGGSSGGASGSAGGGSTAPSGSSGGPRAGGSSQTVGQAEVAVESAQHDLTTAQIALDQATLLAPMTGTLTSLPWSVGDTASTGDVATVTARDATRMTIEVAESAIASVAVGQAAVATSTTGTETPGKVSSIGLLPSESSTSSVTYPVTVVVQQRGDGLAEGTTASARVTVASAADAVIVPMSAVTLTGLTEGTVTVLGAGATTSTARVSLGVRGGTHLEITGGLNAGDTVVLADTSAAIPTSTSTLRIGGRGSSLTGGSGAVPGGGFGGMTGGDPPR